MTYQYLNSSSESVTEENFGRDLNNSPRVTPNSSLLLVIGSNHHQLKKNQLHPVNNRLSRSQSKKESLTKLSLKRDIQSKINMMKKRLNLSKRKINEFYL